MSSGVPPADLVTEGGTHYRVTYSEARKVVSLRSETDGDARWVDLTPSQARRLANRLRAAAAMIESLTGGTTPHEGTLE
jgi:hypothetical protein